MADEQEAQTTAQKKKQELTQSTEGQRTVNLNNLFEQINAGKVKELNVILKVDVQGSLEPIKSSLGQLSTDKVQLRVIRSSSGNITESDVMLAAASQGLIIGFNVGVETGARRLADIEGVDVRTYEIIYNLVDDVGKAIKGVLEPTFMEIIDGRAEVRAVFPSGKKDKAAGSYITEGKATRGATVRVRRGKKVIYESTVNSLRRFKDDVREVAAGYECGVGVEGFGEFQVADTLEFYHKEQSG
jgi:translation initiation factor IF-2